MTMRRRQVTSQDPRKILPEARLREAGKVSTISTQSDQKYEGNGTPYRWSKKKPVKDLQVKCENKNDRGLDRQLEVRLGSNDRSRL